MRRAERVGHEPAAVEADAVVVGEVAAGGEHGSRARRPTARRRSSRPLGRGSRGEREVEARAVGVAVAEVAGRRAGVRHGEHRRAGRRRRPRASVRPAAGDLHRVDDEPLAGQRLQRAGVVAVLHPAARRASTSTGVGPARALLRDDRHRRSTISAGRPRRARAAAAACRRRRGRALTLGRRRRAAAPPASRRGAGSAGRRRARRSKRVERRRRRGARPAATGWTRSHTRVIDAERALAADEQLGEVGPTAAAGRAAGADDRAVGEHHLEPGDDVLDLAVAGGVLAGAAAGDPAADGRDVEALREVPDGQPVVAELALEIGSERAGPAPRRRSEVSSTSTSPASRSVSSTTPPNTGTDAPHTPLRPPAAVTGIRASLHSRSDRGHLVGRSSAGTRRRRGAGTSPASDPVHRQRPPVAARLGDASARIGRRSRRRAQAVEHRGVEHGDGERRAEVLGRAGELDRRRGSRAVTRARRRSSLRLAAGLVRRTGRRYASTWRSSLIVPTELAGEQAATPAPPPGRVPVEQAGRGCGAVSTSSSVPAISAAPRRRPRPAGTAARHERLAERRDRRRRAPGPRRPQRAVARREVGVRAAGGAARGTRRRRAARAAWCGTWRRRPSRSTTSSTVSSRHLPVRRQLAAR